MIQLSSLRFRKDSGAECDGGVALIAAHFTKSMNIGCHLRKLGRRQGLQVFDNALECAHEKKLTFVGVADKFRFA